MRANVKKRKSGHNSAPPLAKQKRTGNRSGQLPCCGKRPERCNCWSKENATEEDGQIVAMLDTKVLRKMKARIGNANILTYKDTADMPHFRRSYPPNHRAPMHYKWGIAMLWRCFSNPHLWSCLKKCGAITSAREPTWHTVEKVLTEYEAASTPSHGG